MNHIYRLVWSKSRQMLVAVAESAGARTKGGSTRQLRRNLARLIRVAGRDAVVLLAIRPPTVRPVAHLQVRPVSRAIVLALLSGLGLPVSALAQPSGGAVVAGQAAITQSGSTTNVHQGTDKAIINWNRFSIGSGETVNFYQPSSSSVALNRVVGSAPSSIYGHLNANGQVFLVNPNGVYFAPGAQVNVGGIVASTLGISNDDFLNGNYHFSGDSTASVVNDGSIIAAQDGYVAFIGNHVANNGDISTPGGTTALGAGGSVDLTLAGNSLLSFKVSSAALNALAENGGVIKADGGAVILTAQAKDALLQTVVNNTGVIQAQTVANHSGTIELLGGDSGTTQVSGTLDASAPSTGDGGQIETSGAHLKIADGTAITTKSATGSDGNWLLDPYDFTIAASGGDITGSALSAALANGDVTITTTGANASCSGATCGSGTSSGNGDINVNDTVDWSKNTLTLSAWRDIVINRPMNATGTAGLALAYGQMSSLGNFSVTDPLGYYNWTEFATVIANAPVNLAPTASYQAKLGSGDVFHNYTIITQLGSSNSTTGTDLQGINGNLSNNYVLGTNIDASATSNWNSGAGFTPLGSAFPGFTGSFEGLGHTISNLTINRPNTDNVGLFGVATAATITNVHLEGGSITGRSYVGGLLGYGKVNLNNDSVTANVTGTVGVGGLAGSITGRIVNSYATGNVTATQDGGGLIGSIWQASYIARNYASGDVNVSGINAGGLVGNILDGTLIINTYATGNVSGLDSSSVIHGVGGLVGLARSSSINYSYASGKVSCTGGICLLTVGGLVGTLSNSGIWYSYRDPDAVLSGISNNYGYPISSSNGDAYKQASYTDWDFTNVWYIDEGHARPVLRAFMSRYVPPTPATPTGTNTPNGNTDIGNTIGTAGSIMQGGAPSPSAGTSVLLDPVASGEQVLGKQLQNMVQLHVQNGGVSPPAKPCTGSASFGASSKSNSSLSCSGESNL